MSTMLNTKPLITLNNICVNFPQKNALKDITFSIFPQSIITLVGPNGGGKTTLLKVLLKLQPPTSGEIIYHQNLKIGYVPQKIYIDPNFPLTVKKFLSLNPQANTHNIAETTQLLSIEHLLNRSLQRLSGGEMQRVLIARAILNSPNLLVLDEPTQGVDIRGQSELYNLINRLHHQLNCAVLMVSHDLNIVMASTNEVICINQHICCSGRADLVAQHPKFKDFFGEQVAQNVAFYHHNHNHHHNLHGDVCCSANDCKK